MNEEKGLFVTSKGDFRSDEQILHREDISFFDHATDFLKESQKLRDEGLHNIESAVWRVEPDFPKQPIRILMGTDFHYGSINTDYDLLTKHLSLVEKTPNTYLVTNGDHCDNFNVSGKWATGVYENPLPPQLQMKSFIQRLTNLDNKGKLGVMSFGNHDNFMDVTGYDWLESFASGMRAPLFTSGGLLHILVGKNRYDLALTHKYWGTSKINPTNACKRYLEHEYPDADIVFLGHTHQSELLVFERGGKERIGIIGGTYKAKDNYARQHGIGGRGENPGITVLLYPEERKMVAFKHIEDSL